MEENKLFVEGISWNLTVDELRAAFAAVGEVKDCVIIMDRETGKSKGFGFVTMGTADEAQKAIESLNGTALDGKPITVNIAKPMKPRY